MVILVDKFYIQLIFQWLYVKANMRVTRFIVSHSFPAINRNTHVRLGAVAKIQGKISNSIYFSHQYISME